MGWFARLLLPYAVLSAILGLVVLISADRIYRVRDSLPSELESESQEVDVIVCLAGAKGRIRAASDLWLEFHRRGIGEDPVLFVSGMGAKSTWSVFAAQAGAEALGVLKPEKVVLETVSANTEENARYFVEQARKKNWRRVVLVTSAYHMHRAKLIFENVLHAEGVPFQLYTRSVQQEPYRSGQWRWDLEAIRVTLAEYIKTLYIESIY